MCCVLCSPVTGNQISFELSKGAIRCNQFWSLSLRFGVLSGEFGRPMFRILSKKPVLTEAKQTWSSAEANPKKASFGIYRIQIQPSDQNKVAISCQ